MAQKFKVGDFVVGNKIASEHYKHITEGTVCIVECVENHTIGVRIVNSTDNNVLYVEPVCLDLISSNTDNDGMKMSSKFKVGDLVTFDKSAFIEHNKIMFGLECDTIYRIISEPRMCEIELEDGTISTIKQYKCRPVLNATPGALYDMLCNVWAYEKYLILYRAWADFSATPFEV